MARDDDIRRLILGYLFDRHKRSGGRRGRVMRYAAPIKKMLAELQALHGLSEREIKSNLSHLLANGSLRELSASIRSTKKKHPAARHSPNYYIIITPAGIDILKHPLKLHGDRFEGIRIETTGNNIITLRDGSQVAARYRQIAEALTELRHMLRDSAQLTEQQKLDLLSDIDSIHDQLAKSRPNKTAIQSLWESIEKISSLAGLADVVGRLASSIGCLLR